MFQNPFFGFSEVSKPLFLQEFILSDAKQAKENELHRHGPVHAGPRRQLTGDGHHLTRQNWD